MLKNVFELLATSPPAFPEGDATRILRNQYGIGGSIKTVPSERDQNFHVESDSGEEFVLKIANLTEAVDVTDFQIEALLHIGEKDPAVPVPRVVPAIGGKTTTTLVDGDGREHIARVLSWLEGIPLRFAENTADLAAQLGAILARLGIALKDFEHPASKHVLLWDLSHAAYLVELLDNIDEESLREQCRGPLTRFTRFVEPALNNLRSQVIHNDLNLGNVLVNPDDPSTITGIIDFGDIVKAPLIIDVSVAAAYLCESGADPLSHIVSFLGGYSCVRPLQKEEVELIFDLIITRNVMTIVIANWRVKQYPENRDYILRSESLARATFDALTGLGRSYVTDVFMKACRL